MVPFEYYLAIDVKYHDEVYGLLQILEISLVDDETAAKQQKALERLEELKQLSKK